MIKAHTTTVQTFPIDGGPYNYGAWQVEEVTETSGARRFTRVGIIREPMIKTYLDGNVFESVNAYGANRQLHKTWDEAVARFQS